MSNSRVRKTDELKQENIENDSKIMDETGIDKDKKADNQTKGFEEDSVEIDESEKKDTQTQFEKEDEETRYKRLAADFQNFKRRTEKEKSEIYAYANEKIAIDMIEVMDNFERAMEHGDLSSDKNFVEGIDLILKQLKSVFDKHDIIEIDAYNKDFDPNYHNAVMMEPNGEVESGKVIQVIQKGYTLKGKVIRPSMVKVSQ